MGLGGLGRLVLGSLILYLNGTKIMMFQLYDFYYSCPKPYTQYAEEASTQEACDLSALAGSWDLGSKVISN